MRGMLAPVGGLTDPLPDAEIVCGRWSLLAL